MNRKVKISETAERKLEKLFDSLLKNWSVKVKFDFIKKLDKSIKVIKLHPKIFPEVQKGSGLYRCAITKLTPLYYRFNTETIFIVTIFDTRQNPSNLKNS
ncbi:type II toxin-antitoxin system RelE/ParE family toxin [Kordia sp. YSTF-M3]|uniref:Type II toxin-antitoxin system RelE/ParE family toxin n=1 Tax=Kordia aestuariivivens TaxID=2759037 RepID=A0ABR7QFB9_9FLAO|nr:type II toxin-antitoxin system RelE/ParE family toxin [Kordia aestuariivivens]MBC8757239.1 type II toxin-antitoxin system RelE/ParE family toxin [Kordia aestuariivivens]